MTGDTALGPGREFELIRDLTRRWGERASGIGDDAAMLTVPDGEQLVASTDSSVENVHFRREWLRPEEIGYRATVAALSDLAAMAATPVGVMLALTLPERWLSDLGALADGVGEAVAWAETRILGGDLVAGGELSLCVTVLGSGISPLRRSGALPGDALFVTGTYGGPLAALAAWGEGREPSPEARTRFARPIPRLREARWLAEHGAHACIDISDGLASDVAHMAHASGVRLELDLGDLPVIGGVSASQAVRSGEEYELALAAPSGLDTDTFERQFGIPLTRLGTVHPGPPSVHATLNGRRVALSGGHDHFT